MKKLFYPPLALLLALSLAPITALAAPAPPAPVYTFKFAGYYPPASPQARLRHSATGWQHGPLGHRS